MPAERFVPLRYSRAVLTAVLLVSVLAFTISKHQGMGSDVWRFVPISTSVMAEVLARVLTSGETTTKHALLEDYRGRDVSNLKWLYNLVLIGAAVGHFCSLAALWLWPVSGAHGLRRSGDNVAGGQPCHWEALLILTSIAILSLVVVFELERVGITRFLVLIRAGLISVGCVFLGPGAMLMVSWRFMEDTMMAQTPVRL